MADPINQHDGTNTLQSVGPAQSSGAAASAAAGPSSHNDALLGTLADIESRFNHLRKLHEQAVETQRRLGELQSALDERDRAASLRESGFDAREQALAHAVHDLERSRVELERVRGEHAAAREQLERTKSEVEVSRRDLEEQRARFVASTGSAEQHASELADLRRQLTDASEAATKREAALAEALKAAQEKQGQAAALFGTLAPREQALREGEAALEAARQQTAERERLLAEREAHLARAQSEHEERVHQTIDEAGLTQSEQAAREERLKELEQHLTELEATLKQEQDALARDRAAVAEQSRQLTSGQTDGAHASALSSGRVEMLQLQLGEAIAAKTTAETELAAARAQAAELSDSLAKAEAAVRSGIDPDAPTRNDIDKRDHAIRLLREKLAETESRMAEALSGAACAGSAGEGSIGQQRPFGGSSSLRRERLRRYKSLLQSQTRKIGQAQAALQRRQAECEQVLAQRSKLAAGISDLARRERAIVSSRARAGAAMAVMCIVVTLGVLSALSYAVAQHFWPGVYIARAELEADAFGREPSPAELESWQKYHQDLVMNPQLIEAAADRMIKRGLTAIGGASALRQRLAKELFVQSAEPGQLTLELRGQGADRTRLVLDTFVTALKSVSDMTREQRAENLGCAIASAAEADPTPLKAEHLPYAGAMLAGGSVAAGLLGIVVWGRLVRTKKSFEHASAVEAALEEVDWATLEQTIRKSPIAPPPVDARRAGEADAQAASNSKKPRGRKGQPVPTAD